MIQNNIKGDGFVINKGNYEYYVDKKMPKSPIIKNCFFAFFVGGCICVIGQLIIDISKYFGASDNDIKTITPIVLIFFGALFTAVGAYDKLGKIAGGGTIIPITGFSNSIVSSAIEFKKEGFVLGVGAKMFTIAGPVIVYGTVASVVYGIIYWIIKMM